MSNAGSLSNFGFKVLHALMLLLFYSPHITHVCRSVFGFFWVQRFSRAIGLGRPAIWGGTMG
jgi:hypothetical protein